MDASTTLAFVSLLSFAIQRFMELTDPLFAKLATFLSTRTCWSTVVDAKRWCMSVASLAIGCVVAWSADLRLLEELAASEASRGGEHQAPRFIEVLLGGLVLGAGTEGANIASKYFNYIKQARREQVPTAVSLTVSPNRLRIKASQSAQLQALVSNARDRNVNWQVVHSSGGSVTDEGLYTAPDEDGIYQVKATSVEAPDVVAIVIITVVRGD